MISNCEEMKKVNVLVVDDHMLFAQGTVALLSFDSRISVVGIAKSGMECMSSIRKKMVDVILLDINLPDVCGTDLIDRIKKVQPELKIIMMTGQDSSEGYVSKSLYKGANGFLQKDCLAEEMINGILKVNKGGIYYSQGLKDSLQLGFNNSGNSLFYVEEIPVERLTVREGEIMELISKGLTNKDIALRLDIKRRTTEFHISNIFSKLGVNTRLEAVVKWLKN